MNFSFVNMPRAGFRFGENIEPLGLLYLSGALKEAGYQHRNLVDADQGNLSIDDCVSEIISQSPDFILCSVLAPTHNYSAGLTKRIKECLPQTKVIWGGIHPSMHYAEILDNIPGVDYVVVGEGERTIVQLIEGISKGMDWKNIKGVASRHDNSVLFTGKQPFLTSDEIPYPDRELLGEKYYENTKIAYMMTQRGCPYNCTFCMSPIFWKSLRSESVDSALSQMYELKTKYGINHIFLWDDVFVTRSKRTLTLLDEMANIDNMTFSCYARVENIDHDIAQRMAKAGFTKVKMGIETPNPRMKKLFNKNFTAERAKTAIDILKDVSIFTHTSLQIGFPEDTVDDIDKTVEFARHLNPDYAYFFLFVPYPDTPLHLQMKEKIKTSNPDNFWLFNPIMKYDHFTDTEMIQQLGRVWYDFYKDRISLERPQIASSNDVVSLINTIQGKIYTQKDKVKF